MEIIETGRRSLEQESVVVATIAPVSLLKWHRTVQSLKVKRFTNKCVNERRAVESKLMGN